MQLSLDNNLPRRFADNNSSETNCDVNVSNAATSFLKPLGFINPSSTVVPRSFTGEFGARFSF